MRGSQQPLAPTISPTLPPATAHPSIQLAPTGTGAPAASTISQVPIATEGAAPIGPYESLRPQQSSLRLELPPLPRPSNAAPAANINSIVNQARLAHSGASQLRVPTLTRRHARANISPIARPAATSRPSLPRPPTINSCLFVRGTETYLRTLNVILPPVDNEEIFFMRFLRGSFLAHMRRFGLVVEDSPLASTPVTAHIRSLVDVLRERGINVDHPAETALLAHEGMPLIPLYVGNRGVARPSDNQIRLRLSPLPPQSTLADMAASRLRFAIPGLCIETVDGESYFCIQWVMSQEFLSATFRLPGIGQEARLHHCLPRRINLVFPRDREFVPWPHEDGASSCDGGDVANLSDLDDEEMDVVASVVHPVAETRLPHLPASIWDDEQPWPPASRGRHPAFTESSVYVAARGASNTPLRVIYSGDTLAEAADELLAAIGRCVDANDFTDVLSEDQNAILYYPRTPEERDSGDGVVRSLGEGVLRDVYQEAFSKVMAGSSRWLTPLS
ncbi:hypothetical protein FB45DRAFT_1029512 [Roridomyces roridus]|uniref:Uncharacterized protein n=1 Tax=Roridomyces roridus TaxID=1738132 RepID=A0AAD7FJ41_9AGAR|nr:hypothetical protein FB45DRAFT_1029512 [Roridomyces roridus]